MNRKHERIIFPRSTLHDFWRTLQEHYAQEDTRNWKYLAMLALHENSGWSLEQIGWAFGHPKGHVSRCLHAVKRELRAQFDVPTGVLSRDDEGFSDPSVDVHSTHERREPLWEIGDRCGNGKD